MSAAAQRFSREQDHPATRRNDATLKRRIIESVAEGEAQVAEQLREELRQLKEWRESRGAAYASTPSSYAVWVEDGKIVERTELKAVD